LVGASASTAISTVSAISTVTPLAARFPSRLGLWQPAAALGEIQNFAFINPSLDADDTVGGVGFGEAVIDVGAQGMQRKLTLQVPFAARDFSAVQAARHTHLNSLAAETQRRIDGLAHGAAEGHAFFELQPDGFRNPLRV